MDRQPPPGFEELDAGLGFTDVLRPVFRRAGEVPAIGMFVRPEHTNLIDICHGGVLMTLADVGAAWAINAQREERQATPTLNLGFDFVSAAREGDWLESVADRVTVKRRIGFASGVIQSGDKIICRFNGTFYLPEHVGFQANPERLSKLHG